MQLNKSALINIETVKSYRNNGDVDEKSNMLHFFCGAVRCTLSKKVHKKTFLNL